jgi:RNA polymerase sigma-70 factor, ECF subfamily
MCHLLRHVKSAATVATPAPAALPFPRQAEQLRGAVRAYIGRRISDRAAAEDLTQDVFAKVLRQLPQVRDSQRLLGWIFRIARNVVIDHYRSARANTPLDSDSVANDSDGPEVIGREETQLREDLNRYVRSVVDALPAHYRQAILLTEYEGLTQVELAQKLGLSVSAAKSRVQRARALVKETINKCCHIEADTYGKVVSCTPRNRCDC